MKKVLSFIVIVSLLGFVILCFFSHRLSAGNTKVSDVNIVPSSRSVWKYSAEYSGEYYQSRVRHYKREDYLSGEWKDGVDEIDYSLSIKCECGNYIQIANKITGGLELRLTCSKCDKAHGFILEQGGLLVAKEDTIPDDEQMFIRSNYVRYLYPN